MPATIERELETAYTIGYRKTLTALDSARYRRLLTALEDFRDQPPTRPRTFKGARPVTARLVDKTAQRLKQGRKAAKRAVSRVAYDTALHQVRKDAKRLRHAAESATTIHGKRSRKLAKAAKRLQQILGDHQDSVLAFGLITRFAAKADFLPDTSRTCTRLLRIESASPVPPKPPTGKLQPKRHSTSG